MTEPEVLEVSVDLADMVKVLTRKNAELTQQNTMLEAAVMRLRREADEGVPQANGEAMEVPHGPLR